MTWAAVAAVCVGCYLLKLADLLLPARLLERPAVARVTDLLPVALLASLVVVQTVTRGPALVADARLPALAVAAVALLLRAPFLVVVGLAAATAALVRGLA